MIYLGIDPGLEGAIAALQADGQYIGVWDIPTLGKTKTKRTIDIRATWALFDGFPKVSLAMIEKVGAMPKQGVTSMFTFGWGLGVLETCIVAHRLPMGRIRPNVWKAAMGVDKQGKDAARLEAQHLFPAADLSLKKHTGRADALLIAEYGRVKHQAIVSPLAGLS